jgi:hypothetical protein
MKKWGVLLLILVMAFCITVSYAEKAVLIDFNRLKANGNGIPEQSLDANAAEMTNYKSHDPVNRTQHMPTLIDYSAIAKDIGSNFKEEDLKKVSVSLSAYNWDVFLNSSAAHNENKTYSYAKEWHTKYVPILADDTEVTNVQKSESTNPPEGLTILGIRIKYPETPYNCWAIIQPPFEIPAYENRTTDYKGNLLPQDQLNDPKNYGAKFENGYGVVKNVGNIKSIDIKVYGCQFKNSLAVILKDDNNVVTEYHLPQYLDFDGWRKLTWNNPNYITNAANRNLYIVPLYPRSQPYVKLYGFRIYRQGDQIGGDFVVYIKDVVITYDKATLEAENSPIEHEEAWGILKQRTIEAKNRELRKIGHNQILRYIEKLKMHQDKPTTTTTTKQ